MTMAQSNSMWGRKSDLLFQICWRQSLEAFCPHFLLGISFTASFTASHLFCCFPILAVIFSFVLICVCASSLSSRSCLSFLSPMSRLSLSFPASHGFVICRSVSVHLHPLPIIILHLIYFSSLPPQRSASVILPLHPHVSLSAYA